MAKSYRNVNLRVTATNDTKRDGVVIYNLFGIETNLKEWAESAGIIYWLIEHFADDEVSVTHFHFVIKFRSPTPFENIKSKFPYGDIEKTISLKNSIKYLIHENDPSKIQYSWDDIHTNCLDMTPYKVRSSSQQEITLQGIYEAIDRGEICEHNLVDNVPIGLYAGNKNKLENALNHKRERVCMDKNRSVNVLFISGATGLGKTTFAKDYSLRMKKVYCISSSSNDPLQDYKGEDVLILDDLRDDSFKFHDFLKLLDLHTLSSSKSRYRNKAFIGDTIIITSTKPLNEWYYYSKPEDKQQLYRRIKTQFQFTYDKIFLFEFDERLHHYVPAGSTPNYIIMKPRDKVVYAVKIMDAMGLELTPADKKQIDDAIENYTEGDWKQVEKEEIEEATEAEKNSRKAYEDSLPPIDEKKIAKHRVG